MKYFFVLFIVLSFFSQTFGQLKPYPVVFFDGDEVSTSKVSSGLNLNGQKISFPPVEGSVLTWTVNPITIMASGYDLQSNGSTQQLWYDINNGFLHSAYCTSQQATNWTDRTTTYFFSADDGNNWIEMGQVPPASPSGARSGFPSIIGLSTGAAVITSQHNGGDALTTSKIHIDSGPAEFNFIQYNPGNTPNGQDSPIWGIMAVTNEDNVVLNSSGGSAYTNVLNTLTGTFSGWDLYNGDQAETYSLATSPSGKIGHAYIGGINADGKAFYRESNDGGLTWSSPIQIFTPEQGDTAYGTLRGISISFSDETPVVAFETIYQIFSADIYFPGMPSMIYVWSPSVNGGVAKIVVDSTNVPYYPNQGTADVMGPICRPVLGRAETGNYIFMGFSAAGPDTASTADATRFFEGWFIMSSDGGNIWSVPERFTPRESPLLDFRYISIAPIAKVTGNVATLHLSAQGDQTPGSQVNGSPSGVTAQFFHFTTDVQMHAESEIPVTFQVDMSVATFEGYFPPGANVVVRGDFQTDAGDPDGNNWSGNYFQLSDADNDTIYTGTFPIPGNFVGNDYSFKYVIVNPPAPDNWESTLDRPFTLTAPETVIPLDCFNHDCVFPPPGIVTNTLNFTSDISSILGVGIGGAFDPNQDSLLIMGLDWDNLGKNVVGNRRMENNDPFNPSIYTTSLTVTNSSAAPNGVGDSTKWKFKAYPDSRFQNSGWEFGQDRWHVYQADGTIVDLPTLVPRIYPNFGVSTNEIDFTLNVDMTGAVNRYNGEPIPVESIDFVVLRGSVWWLGGYITGQCWCLDDTTNGTLIVLEHTSDNIWSYNTTIPAGTDLGLTEFRFGVMYPGADTVNGGVTYLNNEFPFGTNHLYVLLDNPISVSNNCFGYPSCPDAVEQIKNIIPNSFVLEQNYPNPFNPSTKIRYSIPELTNVKLTIYNLLGEEISTLINVEQRAGVYEATFEASNVPSGIYFYTLQTDKFSATNKMLLLK